MRLNKTSCLCALTVALLLYPTQDSSAGFVSFVIREAGGDAPVITTSGGETEFIISESGQKAALGSSDIDGTKVGDINSISIERLDDEGRFTGGSGPAVAPYLNLWITDGTNYAVLANEPSNPAFQSLYHDGYALSFADLAPRVAKVYEYDSSAFVLPTPSSGSGFTFADFANYTIAPPNGSVVLPEFGPGAPIVLSGRSTNESYGVNWVFGDTLSNYVSGDSGYRVQNANVSSTVPEPSSFVIACCGLAFAGVRRGRRRRAEKLIEN